MSIITSTLYSRENPSPRYQELGRIYRDVHEQGLPEEGIAADQLFSGKSLWDHIPRVRKLIEATAARSILDYGSGKGMLYAARNIEGLASDPVPSVQAYWGVETIRCFDPGVPEFSAAPTGKYDGVVCTDVLEHIPEEDAGWFLGELFRFADRFVYANIASFPAAKTLPNGWNAHVTVKPPSWWAERIREASRGWSGIYEFQVREKRGLPKKLCRLIGISRWKTTAISNRGH
jgi:hypothetical protein